MADTVSGLGWQTRSADTAGSTRSAEHGTRPAEAATFSLPHLGPIWTATLAPFSFFPISTDFLFTRSRQNCRSAGPIEGHAAQGTHPAVVGRTRSSRAALRRSVRTAARTKRGVAGGQKEVALILRQARFREPAVLLHRHAEQAVKQIFHRGGHIGPVGGAASATTSQLRRRFAISWRSSLCTCSPGHTGAAAVAEADVLFIEPQTVSPPTQRAAAASRRSPASLRWSRFGAGSPGSREPSRFLSAAIRIILAHVFHLPFSVRRSLRVAAMDRYNA